MKKDLVSVVAGLLVLSLSACVSSGKYKKLEASQSVLQAQADGLAAENAKLQEEVKKAETEKEALKTEAANKETSYNALVGELSQELSQGQLQVKKYRDMLTVDVAEKIFFDSGKAQLKKEGEAVLLKVGEALAKFTDKTIRVVGHTDNVPVSARTGFASNWELSVMRATTVVRFLQEKAKLPPETMIAAGQGEYMPVAPNDSAEGRQKNRRIEIMLLDKAMTDVLAQPHDPQP